jgi:two-component system CheB/CheR fusion protein
MISNQMDHQAEAMSKGPTIVVGLGASAGGLEALQTFFTHMPTNSGLAFVVIQHLSPDYKSLMVELLSKTTTMPVRRIEDGMKIEADTVYLIPPKKNVAMFHRTLLLSDTDHGRGLNLPIDLFFRSLAEDMGERAVGIIFSGTGSDGTRGVRAIKEAGGLAIAQDPSTAKFDGMPTSVIATGLADYILTTEQMPAQLIKFIQHPFMARIKPTGESLVDEEDALTKITAILRRATGVDFALYKPATVVRRIERRMGIAQLPSMSDYLAYLQQAPGEVTALYKDLLIGVTKFFRDTEAFDYVEKKVLPVLFDRKRKDPVIRVWAAGCATGEEAYSLAILLREEMLRRDTVYDVKVFATDIDRSAIEVASGGMYPANIAAEVSEDRLRRFFIDKGGAYQVAREIREMVVFAPHNILKDPPFTKIDLVSCRNMLIYLQTVLQQRVLSLFAFSLMEEGVLFLGASETVGELAALFELDEAKWKVYIRRKGMPPPMDISLNVTPSRERLLRTTFPVMSESRRVTEDPLIADIQSRLITRYAPVVLLMDEVGELVHSFGQLPDYLRLAGGRASLNVIKMLPKEISLALSTAMHRGIKDRTEVVYHNIRFVTGGTSRVADLKVEPMPVGPGVSLRLLVHIEETTPARTDVESVVAYDAESDQGQRIRDLEHELQMSRENLQATVEELETSNEELQATNEELLASNEELQSTNEELQSVNEELYTVNAEYQSKIAELTELNDDIDNLLASSQVGTIFLDADLRIRKFTTAITRELNLLPHDVGRPIADLAHPVLADIQPLIPAALHGQRNDRVVKLGDDRWMLVRLLPYQVRSHAIQGVVVTLIDISPLRRAENALVDFTHFTQALIDTMPSQLCVLDEHGVIVSVNEAWRLFSEQNGGYGAIAVVGENYIDVCERAVGDDRSCARSMAEGIRLVVSGAQAVFSLTYPCHSPTEQRWFTARVARLSALGSVRVVVAHEIVRRSSAGDSV